MQKFVCKRRSKKRKTDAFFASEAPEKAKTTKERRKVRRQKTVNRNKKCCRCNAFLRVQRRFFYVFSRCLSVFRRFFEVISGGLRCLFFGRDTAYAASLFLPRLSSPDGDRPKRCTKSLFEFCAGKGGYGKGDFLCKRSRVRADDDYG